ncbi:MAG TPA: hypothetical protein VFP72_10200 [Kineosporiaceae bacterium]|nr:hypothetical protein [Kineosporiaceae bacterium]
MRWFTRTRALLATLGLTLAAGTAAIALPSSAQAAWGGHHIMVLAPSSARSVLYITSTATQSSYVTCRTISGHPDGRWVDGQMDVYDGAPIRMITFSSTNCSAGYIKATGQWQAPGWDGLSNWWVNLY